MEEAIMTKQAFKRRTVCDSLFRYAEFLEFGDIHIKFDAVTGLKAIIAVHNLKRGPAIGGCRLVSYGTVDKAIEDVLRLAHMMSFKAAANNLPHGGAKSVLIKPKIIKNREAYFEKFGEFVNSLGGCYVTAIDSGTTAEDMDVVARKTKYVSCTTAYGNTSLYTATGVRRSIEAAVHFKLGRDDLAGIHVTIQGAGNVGYFLAKDLSRRGVKLTMADVNVQALQRCVDEFGVSTCSPEAIYDVKADIFSPCALGAVLNYSTIKRLHVSIVAGSANNQLAHHNFGVLLHEKGILYVPDFIANAGGLIHAATLYDHGDVKKTEEQVNQIYYNLLNIFETAAKENRSANELAEKLALERLG